MDNLHDPFYITNKAKQLYPNYSLSPKYKNFLHQIEPNSRSFEYIPADYIPGRLNNIQWRVFNEKIIRNSFEFNNDFQLYCFSGCCG